MSTSKSKYMLKLWYHNYNVMTEKPMTKIVEKQIELEIPNSFYQNMMQASIEGTNLDKVFNDSFCGWNKTSLGEQVFNQMKLIENLDKRYQRAYVEIISGIYYIAYDNFRISKSKFISTNEVNEL